MVQIERENGSWRLDLKSHQTEKGLDGGSFDRTVSPNIIYYDCLPDKYIGRRLNKEEINNKHNTFSLKEEATLRRIFGPKRDEVTGEWRKI
jgi:hypothetical protein